MAKILYSPRIAGLWLATWGYLLASSFCHASGLSVSPAYQDLTATNSANVTYHNTDSEPIELYFSIQRIIATDLLGRLQFNAPLPQTLSPLDPTVSEINPNPLFLNPGETATATAIFDRNQLQPGTSAFLLLAQITSSSLGTRDQALGTNIHHSLGSTILLNTLGGHQTQLTLQKTSLSSFPLRFTHPDFLQLTLKNSGNTRSIPHGPIVITDQFGREILRGAINADATAILPGSQRLIYAHLRPTHFGFPISVNRLQFHLTDDVSTDPIQLEKYYLYLNPYFVSGLGLLIVSYLIIKNKFR